MPTYLTACPNLLLVVLQQSDDGPWNSTCCTIDLQGIQSTEFARVEYNGFSDCVCTGAHAAYSVGMFSPRFSFLFFCTIGICDSQSSALIVCAVRGTGHLIREPPAVKCISNGIHHTVHPIPLHIGLCQASRPQCHTSYKPELLALPWACPVLYTRKTQCLKVCTVTEFIKSIFYHLC